MENAVIKHLKSELTDKEIKVSSIRLKCLKIASKHSFCYDDIVKQYKELATKLFD